MIGGIIRPQEVFDQGKCSVKFETSQTLKDEGQESRDEGPGRDGEGFGWLEG